MPAQEGMHRLTQEILASHEARASGIATLRQEVQADLGAARAFVQNLSGPRHEMATQQRTRLASDVTARRKSAQAFAHDLSRSRQDMAAQQRRALETHHAELARAETQRKAEVGGRLASVSAEHAGARQTWQAMVATLQTRRPGGSLMTTAKTPRASVPTRRDDKAAKAKVSPVADQPSALADRVFGYLSNHPEGARLAELEQEFGLGRLHAARAAKQLVDNGKAEKRNLYYFAI